MVEKLDHDKLIRWLRGLASRQVTAAGSRATFTSDMYFEAADAIGNLHADKVYLIRAATPITEHLEGYEHVEDEDPILIPIGQIRALREAVNRIKGGAS